MSPSTPSHNTRPGQHRRHPDRRDQTTGAPAAQPLEETVDAAPWPVEGAPWGTPGNHLTGPIPRIRKKSDGSLDHDDS